MAIQDKIYTFAEFAQLDALEDDRRLELINGKVVEKVPTHGHSRIVVALMTAIIHYLTQNQIGELHVEASYRLRNDNHNARIPDVSFLKAGREWHEDTPAPYMPDLAVEVQSPKQSENLLREKAAYYIANGSRLVWIIYTEKRLVEVYMPNGKRDLHDGDTLDGGDVLPGLSIPVAALLDAGK